MSRKGDATVFVGAMALIVALAGYVCKLSC